MEVHGAKIADLKSFSDRGPILKHDGLSQAEVTKLGADFTTATQDHKQSLLSAPMASTQSYAKLDVSATGESKALGPVKNNAERLFRAATIRPFTKLFSEH